MNTSTLVLFERSAYIFLSLFIGWAILVLNRRLTRRLGVEPDWADCLGRYGLGVALILHGAVSLSAQMGAPPEWRLPPVVFALACVAIGIGRDLWWPKNPKGG